MDDANDGRKRKLNNNEGIVAPKTSKHNETGTSVQVQQQIASTSYAVVRTEHSTIHSQTYGDENKKIDNAKIDIGRKRKLDNDVGIVGDGDENKKIAKAKMDIGNYGWKMVEEFSFLYIVRKIDDKCVHFTPLRLVEILDKFVGVLKNDILHICYQIMNPISINTMEMDLLNRIVYIKNHTPFLVNKDLMARTDDAINYYKFLKFCHNKCMCKKSIFDSKCDFMKLSCQEPNVPFIVHNSIVSWAMLLHNLNVSQHDVKINDCELDLIKFFLCAAGINKDLYANQKCSIIRLQNLNKFFLPAMIVNREHWPSFWKKAQYLVNLKTTNSAPECNLQMHLLISLLPPLIIPLQQSHILLSQNWTLPFYFIITEKQLSEKGKEVLKEYQESSSQQPETSLNSQHVNASEPAQYPVDNIKSFNKSGSVLLTNIEKDSNDDADTAYSNVQLTPAETSPTNVTEQTQKQISDSEKEVLNEYEESSSQQPETSLNSQHVNASEPAQYPVDNIKSFNKSGSVLLTNIEKDSNDDADTAYSNVQLTPAETSPTNVTEQTQKQISDSEKEVLNEYEESSSQQPETSLNSQHVNASEPAQYPVDNIKSFYKSGSVLLSNIEKDSNDDADTAYSNVQLTPAETSPTNVTEQTQKQISEKEKEVLNEYEESSSQQPETSLNSQHLNVTPVQHPKDNIKSFYESGRLLFSNIEKDSNDDAVSAYSNVQLTPAETSPTNVTEQTQTPMLVLNENQESSNQEPETSLNYNHVILSIPAQYPINNIRFVYESGELILTNAEIDSNDNGGTACSNVQFLPVEISPTNVTDQGTMLLELVNIDQSSCILSEIQCNESDFQSQTSNGPLELILENNVDMPSTSSLLLNTEQNNTTCTSVEETLLVSAKTASMVINFTTDDEQSLLVNEMQNEAITTEHQESNDLQLESSSNNTQDTDNISESSQRSIPELEYLSSKSDDSNFTTLSTLSDTDRSIVYIDIEDTSTCLTYENTYSMNELQNQVTTTEQQESNNVLQESSSNYTQDTIISPESFTSDIVESILDSGVSNSPILASLLSIQTSVSNTDQNTSCSGTEDINNHLTDENASSNEMQNQVTTIGHQASNNFPLASSSDWTPIPLILESLTHDSVEPIPENSSIVPSLSNTEQNIACNDEGIICIDLAFDEEDNNHEPSPSTNEKQNQVNNIQNSEIPNDIITTEHQQSNNLSESPSNNTQNTMIHSKLPTSNLVELIPENSSIVPSLSNTEQNTACNDKGIIYIDLVFDEEDNNHEPSPSTNEMRNQVNIIQNSEIPNDIITTEHQQSNNLSESPPNNTQHTMLCSESPSPDLVYLIPENSSTVSSLFNTEQNTACSDAEVTIICLTINDDDEQSPPRNEMQNQVNNIQNSEITNDVITTEHQQSNNLLSESPSNNTQNTMLCSESPSLDLVYLIPENSSTVSSLSNTEQNTACSDAEVPTIDLTINDDDEQSPPINEMRNQVNIIQNSEIPNDIITTEHQQSNNLSESPPNNTQHTMLCSESPSPDLVYLIPENSSTVSSLFNTEQNTACSDAEVTIICLTINDDDEQSPPRNEMQNQVNNIQNSEITNDVITTEHQQSNNLLSESPSNNTQNTMLCSESPSPDLVYLIPENSSTVSSLSNTEQNTACSDAEVPTIDLTINDDDEQSPPINEMRNQVNIIQNSEIPNDIITTEHQQSNNLSESPPNNIQHTMLCSESPSPDLVYLIPENSSTVSSLFNTEQNTACSDAEVTIICLTINDDDEQSPPRNEMQNQVNNIQNSEITNDVITTEHQQSNNLLSESPSNNTQNTMLCSESPSPDLVYLIPENSSTVSSLSNTEQNTACSDAEVTTIDLTIDDDDKPSSSINDMQDRVNTASASLPNTEQNIADSDSELMEIETEELPEISQFGNYEIINNNAIDQDPLDNNTLESRPPIILKIRRVHDGTEGSEQRSVLTSVQPLVNKKNRVDHNIDHKVIRILNRSNSRTPKSHAYEIKLIQFHGKTLATINKKSYKFTERMIMLSDLVKYFFPHSDVTTVAFILHQYLEIPLFYGNYEHLEMLRDNDHITSLAAEDTPMAIDFHVLRVFSTLQRLVTGAKRMNI